MSIERIINQGMEIPELSCGQLNEGQQALLRIALYKFEQAATLPKVVAEPIATEPVVTEPVVYPDYSQIKPGYTENSNVLGGCTI